MSSAATAGGGPPDWAIANGFREERTAPLPTPDGTQADEGADEVDGNGTGQDPTDQSAGGTGNTTGVDFGSTGTASDKAAGTAPPDAAAKLAAPGALHATTTQSTATTTIVGEAGGAGERKQAEAFWLPPAVHSPGDGSASAATPALDSHHVLLGSPGDPGGQLSGLPAAREAGAMWAVGRASSETPGDVQGASPAAEGGVPSASEVREAVTNLLPGVVVDAGAGLVAAGAGVLDRFSPPQLLEGVTRAAEQTAVQLVGEPEGGSGDGWEAWTVAAGLAAASVELARRQLRRRAARTARSAWNWGTCDVF